MKITFKFISGNKIETKVVEYLPTENTRDFESIFPEEFRQGKQLITFGADQNEHELNDSASLRHFVGERIVTVEKRDDKILINMPKCLPASTMHPDLFLIAMKEFYTHSTLDKSSGRPHRFAAKYGNSHLEGDALKTSLIKELIKELESASDPEELKAVYQQIKNDPRYKVLQKGQDRTTRFFGLKTDSCKALKKIYERMLEKVTVMSPVPSPRQLSSSLTPS